jgi:hypothetical protein
MKSGLIDIIHPKSVNDSFYKDFTYRPWYL